MKKNPAAVWVLTASVPAEPPQGFPLRCISGLPSFEIERILRFKRWQDRHAAILGKGLLQKGLSLMGCGAFHPDQWSRTLYGKPFIIGGPEFSLSHSGNRVVCAISAAGPVGIDIEKITFLDPSEFSATLTQAELNRINAAADGSLVFFEIWTQKESVMKADGRGMYLEFGGIALEPGRGRVRQGETTYYLHMVKMDPRYMCCLATAEENPEVRLVSLTAEDL